MRLLLAEGTVVTTDALREVVRLSKRLRLLDISNNDVLMDWTAANSLVTEHWVSSGRPYLTILTNNHFPWAKIKIMPPRSSSVPPAFSVVHLHRNTVGSSELISGSVLSQDNSSQLPSGLLLPRLRRGNRYRLLCSLQSIPPREAVEYDDQKENSSLRTYFHLSGTGKSSRMLSINSSTCKQTNFPGPLLGELSNTRSSTIFGAGVEEQVLKPIDYSSSCSSVIVPGRMSAKLCQDDYTTDFGQVLHSDMSLETWMMWLPPNQFCNSAALSYTDPLCILTTGSSRAPRPPIEIPQQPRFHYTRGPRNKRRSSRKKRSHRSAIPPVSFNHTDFPPLH
ncbi:hypothetical protein DICVIV_08758 [Dictyocaulus viviparus]|uniref:Uncharacterized protein n=1 Tax=Dictyocaulus viviparus TaxID=29172 RepID=A0A0D8XNB3_DICVI|nr:hypothetical protein DICVIV_08758 [Dictyocaulus viviparus]